MYALIATHNAALRSAIMVLLRICHPGCHVVMANDVADVHQVLESGRCDTMLVDTGFVGYGTTFDADMLREYYPGITFLPLGNAGSGRGLIGELEHGLDPQFGFVTPSGASRRRDEAGAGGATTISHLLRAIDVIGNSEVVAAAPELPRVDTGTEFNPSLTGRQRDVLRLLGEGRSTKDIARRLGLAVPTVKTHLAALYRQLGARNRVEAVVKGGMPRDGRGSRARQPVAALSGFIDGAELMHGSAS